MADRARNGTRPSWLDEVRRAVDAEARRKRRRPEVRRLGPARPVAGPPGPLRTFEIRVRGPDVDLDPSRRLVLAREDLEPIEGADERGVFDVAEVTRHEAGRLTVRALAPGDVPLVLQARGTPAYVTDALADALRYLRTPGLAAALVARPDQRRTGPAGRGHAAAVHATLARGVNVVWGPPGTGKTAVLAEVLRRLTSEGATALLVSNVDNAVDAALLAAAGASRPGQLVRVGHTSAPEVAAHPALTAAAAVRQRAPQVAAELEEVEQRHAELADDPALRRLEAMERALADFDYTALEAAEQRIANADLAAAVAGDLERAEATLAAHDGELTALRQRLREAQADVDAAQHSLRIHHDREALRQERDELARAVGEAQAQERSVARMAAGTRRLRPRLLAARVDTARAKAELARAVVRGLAAKAEVPEFGVEEVDRRLDAVVAVAEEVEAATRQRARLQRRETALRLHLQRVRQRPQPDQSHRDLVRRATEGSVPDELAALDAQRRATASLREEIADLRRRHEQLRMKLARLEGKVVAEAQVVATNVATFTTRRAVRERRYDYVLVDEASTVLPPFLVLAASRADRGVTFLGDFRQTGPRSEHERAGEGRDPAVRRWLRQDVFGLMGITSPAEAEADFRCTVLLEQHRFGTTVTDLLNLVAYDGRLRSASQSAADVTLTLVDVAGLGEAARVRRLGVADGWWPAGALVAAAVTASAVREGRRAGVVAALEGQREIAEALSADLHLDVEVSAARELQGRDLPTVVFDLVEDGRSWMSRAAADRGGRWERDGLRLFTVAATRASRELIVVADGAAIDAARLGPLAALRSLRDVGRIRQVPAAQWLAGGALTLPVTSVAAWPGPTDRASAPVELLAGVPTEDARGLYGALRPYYEAAKESIWIWSPYLGEHVDGALGALASATARGVAVTVFVKPTYRQSVGHTRKVRQLREAGLTVVEVAGTRERLAVVDQALTFAGAVDLPADAGGAGSLLLLHGRSLAHRLLVQREVALLTSPPSPCPAHPHVACYAEQLPPSGNWRWRCPVTGCGHRAPVVMPSG